jgi:hypothetical protein
MLFGGSHCDKLNTKDSGLINERLHLNFTSGKQTPEGDNKNHGPWWLSEAMIRKTVFGCFYIG